MARLYTLGFEIGATAVRAVLVGIRDGALAGQASAACSADGPQNWLEALSRVSGAAVERAGVGADAVVGIGVASTGKLLLACKADGTPLAAPEFATGSESAALFVETGDWLVWQLTTGPFPACDASRLVRSACQAGFGAHCSEGDCVPSAECFGAVAAQLEDVVAEKMRGAVCGPGRRAGELSPAAAQRLGLRAGIAVSAAVIDAHACVPGIGVASPSTLVLAAGGAGGAGDRHLLNSRVRIESCPAGVIGGVRDGILPGYFGYEIRQPPTGAGAEAAAFELRRTVASLRACGVPVRRFVAAGPPFTDDPRLAQVHADVLGEKIVVVADEQPGARGAAVLGCLAAGEAVTGYAHASQAIHAMAGGRDGIVYRVDLAARREYEGKSE